MKLFHIHIHLKPILSKYLSFHSREVIYQCRCGHKKNKVIRRNFGEPFPIETAVLVSYKQFEKVLNSEKIYNTPILSSTELIDLK